LNKNIKNLIANPIVWPSEEKKYAAIFGLNPSLGARSPVLWNRAFNSLGISAQMLTFDVASEHNLIQLLNFLKEDQNFIGGAIAYPYKTTVAKALSANLSEIANLAGAANIFYRNHNASNRCFRGINTDGEAAIKVLVDRFGRDRIVSSRILVIGVGGVGRAVLAGLKVEFGGERIYATNRTAKARLFVEGLNMNWVDFGDISKFMPKFNIIINATVLGNQNFFHQMPLCMNDFELLDKETIIYDLNYDPEDSFLLKNAKLLGFKNIINGKLMNFEQAVMGFMSANNLEHSKIELVRHAMLNNLKS